MRTRSQRHVQHDLGAGPGSLPLKKNVSIPAPTRQLCSMATSSTPHLTLSTSGPPASAGADIRISAIDIGSNSIRQTIADVSPNGTIRVVDEMKAAPRLGAGLLETGVLSEIPIQNALIALSRMATLGSQP